MSFSQRTLLWVLLFAGVNVHMLNYSCLNIAVTAMMKLNTNSLNKPYIATCQVDRSNATSSNPYPPVGEFDWSAKEKSILMGSFSWFMGAAQLTGALLCQKYGGKNVYLASNLSFGMLSCLIPVAASIGVKSLIIVRCLQGAAGGSGNGVAVKVLVSKWVPPNERAKFMSVMAGLYSGASFSYYLNGYIMHFIGWRAVFYTAGLISFVWCTLWFYLVYENPRDNPRISASELSHIEKSIGKTLSPKKLPVPWICIFASIPVLVNTSATLGMMWTTFTFLIYMPSYLQEVHGYSFYQIGQFSSIPFLLETIFTIAFAVCTDWVLQKKTMTVTNIRKLSMLFSSLISGILIACLIFGGCNKVVILSLLTLAIMIGGASIAVVAANLVDMSPNFCAVIHGLQGVACQSMGYVSPLVVGHLTGTERTISQWNKVFLFTSIVNIFSGLLFALVADSSIQPWNYEDDLEEERQRENPLLRIETRKEIEDDTDNCDQTKITETDFRENVFGKIHP